MSQSIARCRQDWRLVGGLAWSGGLALDSERENVLWARLVVCVEGGSLFPNREHGSTCLLLPWQHSTTL